MLSHATFVLVAPEVGTARVTVPATGGVDSFVSAPVVTDSSPAEFEQCASHINTEPSGTSIPWCFKETAYGKLESMAPHSATGSNEAGLRPANTAQVTDVSSETASWSAGMLAL